MFRKKFAAILSTVAFVASITSAAHSADAPAGKFDFTYATRAGFPLLADLYLPDPDAATRPAIILVHGGGFMKGDRKNSDIVAAVNEFTKRGYVAMSVEYRLVPQGGYFPDNAQDAKCAVQWLRANAAHYGIDTSRIAVYGTSAGGYISSFIGTTTKSPQLKASCNDPSLDAQDPIVSAAISFYGVHDFTAFKGATSTGVDSVYFPGIRDKKEKKRFVSPVTYVKDSVPMFLAHGDKDPLVPTEQSRIMHAALDAAAVSNVYIEYPGATHDLRNVATGDFKFYSDALIKSADWLDGVFAVK